METQTVQKTEYVDVVDDYDQAIAKAPIHVIREKVLMHRGVCVIVMNKQGNLLLQKRSQNKQLYPGHYCLSASGAVRSGEDYASAALRELKEETDITPAEIRFLFKDEFRGKENKVFSSTYFCWHDGPVKPQESEVESFTWIPIQEAEQFIEQNKFAPDEILALRKFIQDYYLKGRIV